MSKQEKMKAIFNKTITTANLKTSKLLETANLKKNIFLEIASLNT